MPDKNELLNELAEAREGFKAYVLAVDEDLREERQRRLLVRHSEIRDMVLRAYEAGARIADLKRAYGTTDHNTIKTIIDSAEHELVVRQTVNLASEPEKQWFTWNNDGVWIYEGEDRADFYYEGLDDGGIMLTTGDPLYPNGLDAERNQAVSKWDGAVLMPTSSAPREKELYRVLRKVLDS